MAHQVVCRTRVDEPGRALEFTWSVGSSAFPTYALRDDLTEQFRENTKAARDRLFDLVSLYQPAAADRDLPALRRCCLDLAGAGRNLYNLIFAPEAQPKGVTKTVRRWLREVTDTDGVQSLEVVSEGQPWFAPWNIVYDANPDEDLFLNADPQADGGIDLPAAALRPFWGLCYNLCGGLPVEPLRRRRLPSPPDVLLVIDPVVRDDLALHIDAGVSQQARLLDFVAACERSKARVATSRDQLRKALKKRPHLIYWLGHADPTHLALGDDKVSLADLGNFLRDSDDDGLATSGGLVFLNACQTAESPDKGLGSFLKAFHDADFSGIIATEERTLDNVACPFGLEVMRAFLDERKPIGEVLRRLRSRYAPLGLLYGTYCPPDLQIRTDAAPVALDPLGLVQLGGTAKGQVLGGGGTAVAWPQAEAEAMEQQQGELPPLPDEPYLPLAAYGPEHRALFAGRDDDITRFARVLGRPETRVLVLHGESGVGKSSFLNAGVIPYLDDVAIGYRFHGEDGKPGSVLFVRATDDPAGQVAEALADFAARPYRFTTPAGDEQAVDLAAVLAGALEIEGPVARPAVRDALLADPARLDRALGALASAVPFTLVLVIDQAEEMFTLANPDGSGLADRDRVLRMLSRVGEGRGDYKVIVSLRTEFYGRLIGVAPPGAERRDRGARLPPGRPRPRRPDRLRHPPDRRPPDRPRPRGPARPLRLPLRRGRARGARHGAAPRRAEGWRPAAGAGDLRPALGAGSGPGLVPLGAGRDPRRPRGPGRVRRRLAASRRGPDRRDRPRAGPRRRLALANGPVGAPREVLDPRDVPAADGRPDAQPGRWHTHHGPGLRERPGLPLWLPRRYLVRRPARPRELQPALADDRPPG